MYMNSTQKILKYSFMDMLRSKWIIIYSLFFLIITLSLLYFSANLSKSIISLMNIVLTIVPLISTMIGVFYYYNSSEFVELLLSQPVKRRSVFLGKYLGISFSLALSFLIGMGIPFLIYGISVSQEVWNFLMLLIVGLLLTFVFVGIAFYSSILFTDKIKGFGFAIVIWLFMAIIYDGIFLLALLVLRDFPLEKFAIAATIFNPIDISRTIILLKLDIAALLGYTGAVFSNFFGTGLGLLVSLTSMAAWIIGPVFFMLRKLRNNDF